MAGKPWPDASYKTGRNAEIVAAVRGGMTYGQAAEAYGVSRSVVAGACRLAGLKVGMRPISIERLAMGQTPESRRKKSQTMRAYFATPRGQMHLQKLQRARAERWANR